MIADQVGILNYARRINIPIFVLEFGGYGETIDPLLNAIANYEKVSKIIKHQDDGFFGTDLNDRLKDYNIEQTLLMGVNAGFCVKYTGKSAIKNEFSIITAPSLIACAHIKPSQYLKWYKENGILTDYKNLISPQKIIQNQLQVKSI